MTTTPAATTSTSPHQARTGGGRTRAGDPLRARRRCAESLRRRLSPSQSDPAKQATSGRFLKQRASPSPAEKVLEARPERRYIVAPPITCKLQSTGTMAEPNALRILVVNGKGGCGKTTIATNLAAAYARLGYCVALTDHDSQASSTQWLEQRAALLPSIHLVQAHQRTSMYQTRAFQQRTPHDVERIIIDTPSAVNDRDLDPLLHGVDVILVPLLPSSIDIRAGARFIDQLLAHRSYRLRPVPVGVIANRVRQNTTTLAKLHAVSRMPRHPHSGDVQGQCAIHAAAEEGTGIFDDVADESAEREALEWCKLLHWIDEVTSLGDGVRQLGSLGRAASLPQRRIVEA